MPWLPVLHTYEETQWYFANVVLRTQTVWIAELEGEVVGFMALDGEHLEHLYVQPSFQGIGIGSELVDMAKELNDCVDLWVFQRNQAARQFYEARGFHLMQLTDGSQNEERTPDALYRWVEGEITYP